jgi:hypothetical protein
MQKSIHIHIPLHLGKKPFFVVGMVVLLIGVAGSLVPAVQERFDPTNQRASYEPREARACEQTRQRRDPEFPQLFELRNAISRHTST